MNEFKGKIAVVTGGGSRIGREDRWRILVGEDAIRLDAHVRAEPEKAYDAAFYQQFGPTVPAN